MATNVFDIIKDAVTQRKERVLGELNLLKRYRKSVNRTARVISGHVDRFVGAVQNVLGQFSNKDGFSYEELYDKSSAAIESGWSNEAAAEILSASTEEQQAAVQEALNDFQSSLSSDPSNAFTLARVVYDNATTLNVRRAELINEISETVGLVKLMHDAIPPEYYQSESLELLQGSKPQLEEVIRQIVLACGAIGNGADAATLVRTLENDLEVVVRRLAREEVFDSGQFSPTEYLSLVNRIKDASAELESIDEQLAESRFNIENYQTSFIANYQNNFSECGSLETAKITIENVLDRIDQLALESTDNSSVQAITQTRDFIVDLSIALTLLREFVQQSDKFNDALNVDTSEERTSFEASQAALAAVADFSETLPSTATAFANRAERRLVSTTVDSRVGELFTTLSAEIPVEFNKSYDLQLGLNSFDIDVSTPTRSLFIQSVQDLEDVGLDRAFQAILLGDLTIGFDPLAGKASSVLYSLQQAALAFERGAAGIGSQLGACAISTRFGQAKVSQILADLQSKLQVQIVSRISFRDFVDDQISNLDDKVLKKLERALEELDTLKVFEKCDS